MLRPKKGEALKKTHRLVSESVASMKARLLGASRRSAQRTRRQSRARKKNAEWLLYPVTDMSARNPSRLCIKRVQSVLLIFAT